MPLAQISLLKRKSPSYVRAVADGVHQARIEVFGWIAVLTVVMLMILVVAGVAMRDFRPGDQPSLIEPAAWSNFTA